MLVTGLMVLSVLIKNASGMEDGTAEKKQLSYARLHSLGKDLKEINEELYQRLVANEIDHDGVWVLIASCYQKYYGTNPDNNRQDLALWTLQMAVYYRLPLIMRLILMLPDAQMLPVEVIKNLLYLMASSKNQIFPRSLKIHFFYQLMRLPQIKKITSGETAEIIKKLLDEKTVTIDVLHAILSYLPNLFTPAS